MFRYAVVIAACATAGLMAPATAQDKPAAGDALKADAAALQGRWERVMSTEASLLGKAKRAVKEFQGDKETVTWYADDGTVIRSHRVTFKLSQSGPVRVYTFSEMEVLDGLGKGQKPSGGGSFIYRVEDGELVEVGGLLIGEEFRRSAPYIARWKKAGAEPAAVAVAVEGDMKAAQGVWSFESQEGNGERSSANLLKPLTLTIEGNTFTIKLGDEVVQAGTQTFDATRTPKAVDATITRGQGKGQKMLGIYKLDGDALTVCFDPDGKKRPTEFKAGAGSGTFMNVHKRVKK